MTLPPHVLRRILPLADGLRCRLKARHDRVVALVLAEDTRPIVKVATAWLVGRPIFWLHCRLFMLAFAIRTRLLEDGRRRLAERNAA